MRILIVLLIAWFVVPLALLFLATQVGDPPLILVDAKAETAREEMLFSPCPLTPRNVPQLKRRLT